MKKSKVLLILIFAFIAVALLNTKIYAVDTMNLNITGIRPYTTSQYTVLTPNSNIHTVFKIIKRDDNATDKTINKGSATYVYHDALYCLRSGLGFGSSAFVNDVNALQDVLYSKRYNLKTDAVAVQSKLGNIQSDNYNSILWIIDNMYLPEHSDSESMKANLLKKVGIIYGEEDTEEDKLSDDDIEFVQQMALWYFTNYDENGRENSLSLARTDVLSNVTKVNGQELSEKKQYLITMLYNYFIDGATEHAKDYTASKDILPVKPEIKVDTSSKTVKNEVLWSTIGPFKIAETEGNVGYKLAVRIIDKNGRTMEEIKDGRYAILAVKNPEDTLPAFDSVADTVGKGEFYLRIPNFVYGTEFDLTDVNIETECKYDKFYKTTATLWLTGNNTDQPVVKVEKEEIKEFDLALRKYITKINGVELKNTKVPTIDKELLKTETTAGYAHRKNPVEVKTGNKVTYKISVYNEGGVKGAVTKIIDYLPVGLDFDVADNSKFIEYKDGYTQTDLQGKDYYYSFDTTTRALTIWSVTGTNLFELDAFNGETLDEESLEIVCTVTETTETADKILTNIATMEYLAIEPGYENAVDRDSSQGNLSLPRNEKDLENYKGNKNNKSYLADKDNFYKGQEDDDDFDKVVIKGVPFDLSLRKFITKINGKDVKSRIPQVDTSKINTVDEATGETITTAKYTHSKEPVIVKQGDIVTYKIRVYNEGQLNGYATKIVDYIPEGLGYLIGYKANTQNLWVPVSDSTVKTIDLVGENGLYKTEQTIKNLKANDFDSITSLNEVKILTGKAKISTGALEDEIIKAYNPNLKQADIDADDNWQQSTNGTDGLYYREVEITCIVLAENTYTQSIRNIAEIEEDKVVNSEGDEITASDRDSTTADVDKDNYNPPADNSSYQQDDDDYELIELKYFDLALRKYITKVNEEEVKTRIPEVKVDENGQIKYEHDKTPVYLANSDIVTYTIRVYNEGTVLGYAMEIADDIPDGLVFLPEYQTNRDYGWTMYDKDGVETTNVEDAVEIRTKYLEKSLLNPYDPTKEISDDNPDNAEVKVAFQVIEENITQEDRILINKAQITKDKAVDEEENEIDINDEDSIPDEWNEGEDDQDIEKVYVKKFDLSLLKWVTQTIVTVDGKTTTTDTGFTPYDNPEPIAKVVIDKKKLNKTTVKFVYNIMITNQGEIEGYATEITDYIPVGLEFVAEDNPLWEKAGDNKITTRMLEEKLLKPGETATIQVIFRWKQDADNLGVKTNIAEISEDYNDKGAEDIDSTPDNVKTDDYDKQQEDDDDKAIVMLEIKTGGNASYIWLGLVVLLILASGIILIQKYVL